MCPYFELPLANWRLNCGKRRENWGPKLNQDVLKSETLQAQAELDPNAKMSTSSQLVSQLKADLLQSHADNIELATQLGNAKQNIQNLKADLLESNTDRIRLTRQLKDAQHVVDVQSPNVVVNAKCL